MEVQGGITGSEKGCHYFCAPYFQLGFCMGGIGFFKSAYSGFYFDEKRIFLFSAGNDFTGIAGDSGRPGEKDSHLVDQMITEFKKRDSMYLCITPEGSRSKRKKWKKGFLVIAKAAGVPVYLGRIDYKGKYCEIGPLFNPTDDVDADLQYIMSTYKDANPRHPEKFSWGE